MLRDVLWPDAEILSLSVDYDAVVIHVRESRGATRVVRCEGYIGYSSFGFWDELVVRQARLLEQYEAIDRCVAAITKRLGPDWPSSGNTRRNVKQWKALIIHFSDESSLEVVAVDFTAT